MLRNETVEIDDVFVKIETEKALLCQIDEEEFWIPKSQIAEDSEVYKKNQTGTLTVARWLAEVKGLVG